MIKTFGDALDSLGKQFYDPSALIQFPIIEIKEGKLSGTDSPCEGCPNALHKANGMIAVVLGNSLAQEKHPSDSHLSLPQAAASHGLTLRKETVASIVCAHGANPVFSSVTSENRGLPLVPIESFQCAKKPTN